LRLYDIRMIFLYWSKLIWTIIVGVHSLLLVRTTVGYIMFRTCSGCSGGLQSKSIGDIIALILKQEGPLGDFVPP